MVYLWEKKDKIVEDLNNGASVSYLAKKYKASYNTMLKYLVLWGVKTVKKRGIKENFLYPTYGRKLLDLWKKTSRPMEENFYTYGRKLPT